MPKLAPFILQATFLTHDNNFHLYLSRECEKRALHHRARVPRGCRISRPGGLGPHLRSGRKPRAGQSGHGLSLPPGVSRPCRPRGPGGETLAKEKREIRLPHLQDAGGWGKENGGKVVILLAKDTTLTSQEEGAAGFQAPSGGTHFCPSASSPTLEGTSKIITLMFEIIVFPGVRGGWRSLAY